MQQKSPRLLIAFIALMVNVSLFLFSYTNAFAEAMIVTSDSAAIAVDGTCTLPEAIQNANDNAQTNADCPAGGTNTDVIYLMNTGQIDLAGTPLTVNSDIVIDGSHNNTNSISGGNTGQIFVINSGKVQLIGLNLKDGATNAAGGAAISNTAGQLIIRNTQVQNSVITGAFFGGAIYNTGVLTIVNSAVLTNRNNIGGAGGAGCIATAAHISKIQPSPPTERRAMGGLS